MQIGEVLADSGADLAKRLNQSATDRDRLRELNEAAEREENRLRELLGDQAEIHAELMIARHATQSQNEQTLTSARQQTHQQPRGQRMAQRSKRQLAGS